MNEFWQSINGTQLWRVLNISACAIALVIMGVEAYDLRHTKGLLAVRTRFRNLGGLIVLITLTIGSVRAIHQQRPVDALTYFLTVGVVLLMCAMFTPVDIGKEERDEPD